MVGTPEPSASAWQRIAMDHRSHEICNLKVPILLARLLKATSEGGAKCGKADPQAGPSRAHAPKARFAYAPCVPVPEPTRTHGRFTSSRRRSSDIPGTQDPAIGVGVLRQENRPVFTLISISTPPEERGGGLPHAARNQRRHHGHRSRCSRVHARDAAFRLNDARANRPPPLLPPRINAPRALPGSAYRAAR